MPWIWSCHKCHTRYALGTTRRCLHDGHYFCGGTTVDKVTGKTKRHRACASEFDYIGWENFNNWKREQSHPQNPHLKHCENQCDFPSACHWKTRHTPQKDANFSSFLDPKYLETEELPQPKPSTKTTSSSQGSELTFSSVPKIFTRIVKAAEKRTSQITTLLSTFEEESNFTSTPGYVSPSPSNNPPTQQQQQQQQQHPTKLNPLSLHLPLLEFSHEPSLSSSISTLSDHLPTPTTENSDSPNVNMADWIPESDISSPPPISPTSPTPPPKSPLRLFDFSIATSPTAGVAIGGEDIESPISPVRTVWEWTPGGVGIALSAPVRIEGMEEREEEEEEDGEEGEEGEVEMLWERDVVFRRVSV